MSSRRRSTSAEEGSFLIPLIVLSLLAPMRAQADPARCIDPAMPFLELVRLHDWPPPTSPRSAEAFAQLQQYLRTPTAGAYRDVLAEYKWLSQYHRTDAHIRLALGVLYTAGPDLNFHGADGYRHNALANNSNAADYAARILGDVIAADSASWLAAVALTRIALVAPDPARMEQAVAATAFLLRQDSSSTIARLLWHDLLVAQERGAEAAEFSSAYPPTCTALKHARAEAFLLSGDTAAGARLYLATLDSAAPDELHRFYDDIRVMATPGQLADYMAAQPEERPQWIEAFWKYSATSFARSIETRVAEHVVRAAYADAHFRAAESGVATHTDVKWISDTTHLVPWDTRGVLYVRHGAPLHRLRVMNQCSEPYEVWVYTSGDRPWIFWFTRNCLSPAGLAARGSDWRHIPAPPLCGRPFLTRPVPTLTSSLAKLRTDPGALDRREIYTLLAQYDPRYGDILTECAKVPIGGVTLALQRMMPIMVREGIERFERAQWTESSFPQLAKRVDLALGAYEFRDAQQRAELAVVSWIPAGDLSDSTSAATRMRFSTVLSTPPLTVMRQDTTVMTASAAGGVLRSIATLRGLRAGDATLRVIALDPADTTRGGVRAVPLNIRGSDARRDMSDIVIGVPNAAGPLRRGDRTIAPLPGHQVRVGASFRLFAELYGAERGEEAQTAIRIRRIDNSALAQLRRLFPGRDEERTLSFTRQVELDDRGVMIEDVLVSGDLLPGVYTVEIAVTLPFGERLVRQTTLRIAEPAAQ